MARQMNYKRPKDLKRTVTKLMAYLGNHKFAMFIVAILVILSDEDGCHDGRHLFSRCFMYAWLYTADGKNGPANY